MKLRREQRPRFPKRFPALETQMEAGLAATAGHNGIVDRAAAADLAATTDFAGLVGHAAIGSFEAIADLAVAPARLLAPFDDTPRYSVHLNFSEKT